MDVHKWEGLIISLDFNNKRGLQGLKCSLLKGEAWPRVQVFPAVFCCCCRSQKHPDRYCAVCIACKYSTHPCSTRISVETPAWKSMMDYGDCAKVGSTARSSQVLITASRALSEQRHSCHETVQPQMLTRICCNACSPSAIAARAASGWLATLLSPPCAWGR